MVYADEGNNGGELLVSRCENEVLRDPFSVTEKLDFYV
jgi:hypothetical protein